MLRRELSINFPEQLSTWAEDVYLMTLWVAVVMVLVSTRMAHLGSCLYRRGTILSRVVSVSSASVLLAGGWTGLMPTLGWADDQGEPRQVAQSLGTLPPLPPSASAAPATVPVSVVNSTNSTGRRYLVYVNGDSPLLLDQVRLIEPTAFRKNYQGNSVIQTGLFDSPQNAQNQVNQLASQGIGATIAEVEATALVTRVGVVDMPPPPSVSSGGTLPPVPVTAVPNSVEFGQPPNLGTATAYVTSPQYPTIDMSGYVVVVPGASEQLPTIRNQVIQLGAIADGVHARSNPLGPNVAIGPFVDRNAAERWSDYLRSNGLDARVNYE